MLIWKTVEITLEKSIIKSNIIIVDATHTKARYNLKSPKKFLQEEAKNSELKNGHGYDTASSAGLFGMGISRSHNDICRESQANIEAHERRE